MALVADPVLDINFFFRDNNRKGASTGLFLPAGITLVNAESRMGQLRDALVPLTNAQLVSGNIRVFLSESTATGTPPPESEVERKLLLTFATTNRRVKFTQEIPSPVFALEQANTDVVALDNPLLAAYASAVTNGVFTPGNGSSTAQGLDITGLESAIIVHRQRPPR